MQWHISFLRTVVHMMLDSTEDELCLLKVLSSVLGTITETVIIRPPGHVFRSISLRILIHEGRCHTQWIVARICKATVEGCFHFASEIGVDLFIE